jgi:threonine/homoserine/homoserine lactone efflux protein
MIPIDVVITFILTSILLSIAPGPDNIFVLTQSALKGWKSGIIITLGLGTGLIVHTCAVALGVAALLQTSPIAFTVLKYAGAAFLLFLAFQALRTGNMRIESSAAEEINYFKLYTRGIVMNVSNPKVSIFFLAFLPQFTSPSYGNIANQIFQLGTLFICSAFFVFSGISLAAGTLGQAIKKSTKVQSVINKIAGFVLIGLALKLAISR